MTINVFSFGSDWLWELYDKQGHPVCRCAPRHGVRAYLTKKACIDSAERFYDLMRYRCEITMLVSGEFHC